MQHAPLYHAITNLAGDDNYGDGDDGDGDDGNISEIKDDDRYLFSYETISRNTLDSKISSDHALSKLTSSHNIPTSMPALYFPVLVSPDIDGCEVLVILGEKTEHSQLFDTSIILIRQSEYTKNGGQIYDIRNKVDAVLSWADIRSWVLTSPVEASFSSCFQKESTNLSDDLALASAFSTQEDLDQNYIVIFSII